MACLRLSPFLMLKVNRLLRCLEQNVVVPSAKKILRLLLCAQRSYLEPRDKPFCRPRPLLPTAPAVHYLPPALCVDRTLVSLETRPRTMPTDHATDTR